MKEDPETNRTVLRLLVPKIEELLIESRPYITNKLSSKISNYN